MPLRFCPPNGTLNAVGKAECLKRLHDSGDHAAMQAALIIPFEVSPFQDVGQINPLPCDAIVIMAGNKAARLHDRKPCRYVCHDVLVIVCRIDENQIGDMRRKPTNCCPTVSLQDGAPVAKPSQPLHQREDRQLRSCILLRTRGSAIERIDTHQSAVLRHAAQDRLCAAAHVAPNLDGELGILGNISKCALISGSHLFGERHRKALRALLIQAYVYRDFLRPCHAAFFRGLYQSRLTYQTEQSPSPIVSNCSNASRIALTTPQCTVESGSS